jgi:UDP-glucuronate decarboxylase
MHKKKILIAGGAGFIGTNLCKKLLELGHSIVVLDNLSTGRRCNITQFEANQRFRFIEHDIIQPINIECDWIFNLASPASPPHYQKDPIQTMKTNVIGVLNLLELARKNKARILQASTSEVYGDPFEHPQKESYRGNVNPIGPRACYDEGKRCAETLFFDYHRMHGLDIKVVRIFNTYGPHMDPQDGRVVSNFIVNALDNKPLQIYGDGSQTRSFCYVDDMVAGLIAMMHSSADVLGPINLGNPSEFTVKELACTVLQVTKSSSKIEYFDLPQDDPQRRRPDISQAKKLLEWEPRVELCSGIEHMIHYFKSISMVGRVNNNHMEPQCMI